MNTPPLSCSPVHMGTPNRNRTSILRSNDSVKPIKTEGHMWFRVIIDEGYGKVSVPVKKTKNKIKPTVIKNKKFDKKKSEAQLLQALKTSKTTVAAPVPVFPSSPSSPSSNASYEAMISSITGNGNSESTKTDLVLPSSEPSCVPVTVAAPERPQMTGKIWPHVTMKRPYSPTMMGRPGRPRAITMDDE